MLLLPQSRLVYLANPKTATQSIRSVLRPLSLRTAPFGDLHSRHMPYPAFDKNWRARVEAAAGGAVETVAVVREPFARLESWFRYRHKNPDGAPNSSRGISFDAFAQEATRLDDAAEYARVGDQARFCGWDGARAGVTHVFDYARLDLLVAFLADRLGQHFDLPMQNVSLTRSDVAMDALGPAAQAAYRDSRPAEFALYAAVAKTGYLRG